MNPKRSAAPSMILSFHGSGVSASDAEAARVTAGAAAAAPRLDTAALVAAIERWFVSRGEASWDPYDGLTSPVFRPLTGSRLASRAAMQVVKRSPINLRPLLGIHPAVYPKALSDLVSAYVLLHRLRDASEDAARARRCRDALDARSIAGHPGSCWGMDLPYVSRFATATPGTPNLFQTVNAAWALLDAYAAFGEARDLERAAGVVEFQERGLGRLEDGATGLAWRYYPGQDACVYNVNALAGALLLRLARVMNRPDLATLGRRTLAFVVAAQNPDGGWYYARGNAGRWVDGFHTGYVLEALLEAQALSPDADLDAALARGVAFYGRALFTPAGVPRYTDRSTYPIEVQNCAQAVQTWAKLARRDPSHLPRAREVASQVVRALYRTQPDGTGAFILSRGRAFTNPLVAVRWGQAPMLLAFAHLLDAERSAAPAANPPR